METGIGTGRDQGRLRHDENTSMNLTFSLFQWTAPNLTEREYIIKRDKQFANFYCQIKINLHWHKKRLHLKGLLQSRERDYYNWENNSNRSASISKVR